MREEVFATDTRKDHKVSKFFLPGVYIPSRKSTLTRAQSRITESLHTPFKVKIMPILSLRVLHNLQSVFHIAGSTKLVFVIAEVVERV